MRSSGCGACGAQVPGKDEDSYPGWLTGTIRRRSSDKVRGARLVRGKFGEARTFACCPQHRVHVVRRTDRLRPKTASPTPSVLVLSASTREHPSGCYGCRASLAESGAALVRMSRALHSVEEYVELRIRICRDCAIEIR